jgi:hypothetical protein
MSLREILTCNTVEGILGQGTNADKCCPDSWLLIQGLQWRKALSYSSVHKLESFGQVLECRHQGCHSSVLTFSWHANSAIIQAPRNNQTYMPFLTLQLTAQYFYLNGPFKNQYWVKCKVYCNNQVNPSPHTLAEGMLLKCWKSLADTKALFHHSSCYRNHMAIQFLLSDRPLISWENKMSWFPLVGFHLQLFFPGSPRLCQPLVAAPDVSGLFIPVSFLRQPGDSWISPLQLGQTQSNSDITQSEHKVSGC